MSKQDAPIWFHNVFLNRIQFQVRRAQIECIMDDRPFTGLLTKVTYNG